MKKSKLKDLLFLSAILAVVFGTVSSIPAGLVARYGFEGNANDLSGNGLNGQLRAGGAFIADAERGRVLSLDGDGAYVDLGNPAAFNLTNKITISLWIKVDKFDRPHQTIISKGDTGWRLARSLKNTDALEFGCGYWEDYPAVYGEIRVNDGKWHHIACVNNGIVQYLYVDGQLDGFWPVTASPAIQTNSFPVLIGENAEYRERSFNGMIDDVVIFDYALTADQVRQLHTQEPTTFLSTVKEATDDSLSLQDKLMWLQTRRAILSLQLGDDTEAVVAKDKHDQRQLKVPDDDN
jgi:hypothetical protein